ncbi:sigma 54-interacting transcriptional regulator [Myxococcus llanfairpwllgwyngyllgogerychwyrndrobwllllantysiliogogogochensis]|uniref:sigma 54-interacting transcriptional regulator n=1 Tax=Myxococcus llanfairpwllgwyngyllgogerychwyrndrobwllllantysiliogogogochensis TaxID=2590453 RepID=UPI0015EFF5DE|nr:sigma 54-interacting transcriptional regulator [Myxococcus llanfairpwllgwyngyllgogerychwyrndrobwllllantysiliogogogochensis]
MTRPVSAYAPRSERKPLYVKVVTQPALPGCWAVNISETGIGLIATPRGPQEGPREGESVELSFSLPDSNEHIRARGDVRWRHESGGAVTALGVFFHSFEGSDGVKLARYLTTARLQVVVVFASEEEARDIRAALEGQAVPHFAASAEEAHALLARGDAAALLVCGQEEARALTLVEGLATASTDVELSGAVPPSDLASRIIYCAPAAPERLVALFNAGLVFRALGESPSREAVRQAVLQAGRERGVRTEQWRMTLELERNLLRERALSQARPTEPGGRGEEEVGLRSAAMQRVMEMVRQVAPHRVAVLLQGETGTGKEVLARIVHRLSGRGELPLVVQDCGALTETLLESELFGHVKGAFTNAVADHPGLFVLANGGTIFLDEIENTTPNLQAKLLRVLETGDVRPVGGTQVRHVDVRVLAASNKDLGEEVRAGRFRSDLFYRLNSFTIDIPPLRERPEDVPELARYFLHVFNRVLRRSASGMSQDVEDMLRSYPWPGNVRELRNVLERAVLLSRPGEVVSRRLLPPSLVTVSPARNELAGDGSLRARLERVERELIREALERHGGVLRRAAVALGMDPVTLGRRARRHGLWKSD